MIGQMNAFIADDLTSIQSASPNRKIIHYKCTVNCNANHGIHLFDSVSNFVDEKKANN